MDDESGVTMPRQQIPVANQPQRKLTGSRGDSDFMYDNGGARRICQSDSSVVDESVITMPSQLTGLVNQTLLKSTNASVDLDTLYVNSVVHSIRSEGTGDVARGKLWESLHRALLGLRSSKAALEAVASAGGTVNGDILKEETRELFHQLRDECSNFGSWKKIPSSGSTLSPRSVSAVRDLPAINSMSANNQHEIPRNETTSENILDMVLGQTKNTNASGKTSGVNGQTQVSSWQAAEREILADELLRCLRSLGVLKTIASPLVDKKIIKFLANMALSSIEPCDDLCLDAQDVSNLIIDSFLTNSRHLPLSFSELDRLSEWRTSRITWMAIFDTLTKFTWRRKTGRLKGPRSPDGFILRTDSQFKKMRGRQEKRLKAKYNKKYASSEFRVRFRCAGDAWELRQKFLNEHIDQNIHVSKMAKDAESTADKLLRRLATSAKTLSPIEARKTRESLRTNDWSMS